MYDMDGSFVFHCEGFRFIEFEHIQSQHLKDTSTAVASLSAQLRRQHKRCAFAADESYQKRSSVASCANVI